MATPNPYDVEDTCRCNAWSRSECACDGFVDLGQVRAWQRGYDAAIADISTGRVRAVPDGPR